MNLRAVRHATKAKKFLASAEYELRKALEEIKEPIDHPPEIVTSKTLARVAFDQLEDLLVGQLYGGTGDAT